MFERYTKKARRVIFFARYKAIQFSGSCIDAEFVLLGILHVNRFMLVRWLGDDDWQKILREEVEKLVFVGPKRTTSSSDLKLSREARRVLAYAAEEADRLSHRYISAGHLFLGLLRDPESRVAKLLSERGVKVNTVRETLAKEGADPLSG